MKTPITGNAIKKYDNDPVLVALAKAWYIAGSNPAYHSRMVKQVEASMPLLARALDRLPDPTK